jgi:methyl-accepting chemotaxis protein
MATSSNISWLKTIRTKIITATIVTTTLVLGVSGYFAYKYTETSKSQELQQLAEVTADRLSQHLEVPMWDVDYDQVGKLLEAEMKELKIAGIAVRDEDKKSLFSARERNNQGGVVESQGNLTGNYVNATREVKRGDKIIGNVNVILTPSYLKLELLQFAQGIGGIVIILNLVMLIIIGTVLGRVIVRPLKRLAANAERISQGDLNQEIEIHSGDEIGYLASTLNRMQLSLRVAISRLTKK